MLKYDEIIEKLDEKFEIIQKIDGYKYGEDTILLFKLFQESLNKKNIKNNKSHCIHNPISSTNNRKTIRTEEEKKTIIIKNYKRRPF